MNRRGQSLIEYAVLILGAAIALATMYGMIRNAASHRIKTGADSFGHGMRYPE